MVLPKRGSLKTAFKFLESKEKWIRDKLAEQPDKIVLDIGMELPVMGVLHNTTYGSIRGKSAFKNGKIIINGEPSLAGVKIKKLLSTALKAEIEKLAAEKAAQLAVNYKKITIRDNVSRWGSCSSKGTLSFCWRIVFAPHEVIEYLVCHEIAHLAEMNHGKNFWKLVEKLDPHYEKSEAWLKKNGNSLHLYS